MTLSSRHKIRNSTPGSLRPSTLPLGHGGSPQYWLSHVDGEETFCFFQTEVTGNRTPNSGVKGSGANHYRRAPARGGSGTVVKAAFLGSRRSRVQSPLWNSSFKEKKCLFPAHSWRFNIVGSLRDREGACSASDSQGLNFELCVWSAVSSDQGDYMSL